MELNIIKEEKDELEFEIVGEDHTLCNWLRKRLWDQKGTEYAAYSIKHPQIASPIFLIKGNKPRKLVLDTISAMKKELVDFNKAIKSL